MLSKLSIFLAAALVAHANDTGIHLDPSSMTPEEIQDILDSAGIDIDVATIDFSNQDEVDQILNQIYTAIDNMPGMQPTDPGGNPPGSNLPMCDMDAIRPAVTNEIGRLNDLTLALPCQNMNTFLEQMLSGPDRADEAPDANQICTCLKGFDETWADANLQCDLSGMGMFAAMDFWELCQDAPDNLDCESSEATECVGKCSGCLMDPSNPTFCPPADCENTNCDDYMICMMFGPDSDDGDGLGQGSGAEPTPEPTWEPTFELIDYCSIYNIRNAMTQSIIRGEAAFSYAIPCQNTGTHLGELLDGQGGLTGEPNYPLICSCVSGFTTEWAEQHLDCEFGAGIRGLAVHEGCLNGEFTSPTDEPTAEPTMEPMDPTEIPTEEPTPEPTRLPTQPPVEPTKEYTVDWDVRVCCMSQEECEASGAAVVSVLNYDGEVVTTCTAVADRRRAGEHAQTWDVNYELKTTDESEANSLQLRLNQNSKQNEIKDQIEADTGATVSTFDAEWAQIAERRIGGEEPSSESSGLGAGAIAGIAVGIAVLGAGLAFVVYKLSKSPSEQEKAMSPRLIPNDDLEGEGHTRI